MNANDLFMENFGIDADNIIDIIPAEQERKTAKLMKVSPMLESAALENGQDSCLAMLAQTAMERTCALTVMANRLTSIAPQGAPLYAAIAATYAKKAVERLERW